MRLTQERGILNPQRSSRPQKKNAKSAKKKEMVVFALAGGGALPNFNLPLGEVFHEHADKEKELAFK